MSKQVQMASVWKLTLGVAFLAICIFLPILGIPQAMAEGSLPGDYCPSEDLVQVVICEDDWSCQETLVKVQEGEGECWYPGQKGLGTIPLRGLPQ